MWLRVSHDERPRPGSCRGAHPTLRAAVLASRPGDTILVEPGAWHEARDVAVRWPLRIVGGGDAPADTVLHCPRGADAALDFRWDCREARFVQGFHPVCSYAMQCERLMPGVYITRTWPLDTTQALFGHGSWAWKMS